MGGREQTAKQMAMFGSICTFPWTHKSKIPQNALFTSLKAPPQLCNIMSNAILVTLDQPSDDRRNSIPHADINLALQSPRPTTCLSQFHDS